MATFCSLAYVSSSSSSSSSSCCLQLWRCLSNPKNTRKRSTYHSKSMNKRNTIKASSSSSSSLSGANNVSRRDILDMSCFMTLAFTMPANIAIAEEEGSSECKLEFATSGLGFCDTLVGSGLEATTGQLIKAHYTGKLENGKVFDSSYERGKPLTFRVGVGEVIKGWDQGIIGGTGIPPMLAGGKRRLKIPPELGYGARGAGCRGGSCIIPPDSILLFDVEFLGKA